MSPSDPSRVTRLLQNAGNGDAGASERLLEAVYQELKQLARGAFAPGAPATLQPTALVDEAWMKLAGHLAVMENRVHFYSVAGKAMRQIVADQARARRAAKRGSGKRGVTLCDDDGMAPPEGFDIVDLDDSLNRLRELNERHATVVELRFLCGLTLVETASALDVSVDVVKDDWTMARAWLRRELGAA